MPTATSILTGFLDLLAPRDCPGCGEPLPPLEPHGFCTPCEAALEPSEVPDAAYPHGGPMADAIARFKYGGRPDLARPLGARLAEVLLSLERPFEAVAPVPLHAARRHQRGYDQAALLARELARHAGKPFLPTLLTRVRDTGQQVGRDGAARRLALRGAFVARPCAGLRVLLVDDVRTTSATLEAAADAVVAAGAAEVSFATLTVASSATDGLDDARSPARGKAARPAHVG